MAVEEFIEKIYWNLQYHLLVGVIKIILRYYWYVLEFKKYLIQFYNFILLYYYEFLKCIIFQGVFTPNNYSISKCYMPVESTEIKIYIVSIMCIFIYFIIKCKLKQNRYYLLKFH